MGKRKTSCEYYEIFSKHLNIVQVYIFDTGYLLPHGGYKLEHFIETIKKTVNTDRDLHATIRDRLQQLLPMSLQYMDTHRDKQVVKALFAKLTSVKFATQLQGIKSRQGTASARKALESNLQKYDEVKRTSQIVRNDLTTL